MFSDWILAVGMRLSLFFLKYHYFQKLASDFLLKISCERYWWVLSFEIWTIQLEFEKLEMYVSKYNKKGSYHKWSCQFHSIYLYEKWFFYKKFIMIIIFCPLHVLFTFVIVMQIKFNRISVLENGNSRALEASLGYTGQTNYLYVEFDRSSETFSNS